MKTNSPQSMTRESRRRNAVLLFAFLSLICLGVTSGLAQLKNQKRVTALQLGDTPDGARVTIVADSALNDYEAFRRGDRFYVKIPLADFAAAPPNFRGNGFEDVQVQEVGDSVVVSFKLQPGATARVDQRSNRLDVIFSALGVARNVPGLTAVNSYPTTRNRRSTGNKDAIAGPMPPSSPPTSTRSARTGRTNYPASSRENSATRIPAGRTNYPASSRENSATRIPAGRTNYPASSRENSANRIPAGRTNYPASSRENSANRIPQAPRSSGSTRRNVVETGADPNSKRNSDTEKLLSKTKPSFTPPTSSLGRSGSVSPVSTPTPAPFSTPTVFATPYVQQATSAPVSVSSRAPEATGWESRIKFLKAWAELNRSALMIGGLIALALLIGLVFWSRLRGRGGVMSKASRKTPGKPISDKAVARPAIEGEPFAATPVAGAARPYKEVWVPQPAPAGFATAAAHEHRDADQEREVFEL